MKASQLGGDDPRLDAIFAAYRNSCPAPEPGPHFMPQLWERIEARQRITFSFRRLARGFVTAAAALCIGMTLYQVLPGTRGGVFTAESYVEALSNHPDDSLEFLEAPATAGEL